MDKSCLFLYNILSISNSTEPTIYKQTCLLTGRTHVRALVGDESCQWKMLMLADSQWNLNETYWKKSEIWPQKTLGRNCGSSALGTLGGNYLGTLGNSEFISVKLLDGHWATGQTLGRYWMSLFLIQDKTSQFFHAR